MPLRPVNAIFYEPKSKFIVIYQNGQLWQLPRMKVDLNSWRNRKAYKGTKTALYLNKEQTIKDAKLAKILPTESLPSTLINMSLPKFESWWLANSYEWLKTKHSNLEANVNVNAKEATNRTSIKSQTSSAQVQNTATETNSNAINKPQNKPQTRQIKETINQPTPNTAQKAPTPTNSTQQTTTKTATSANTTVPDKPKPQAPQKQVVPNKNNMAKASEYPTKPTAAVPKSAIPSMNSEKTPHQPTSKQVTENSITPQPVLQEKAPAVKKEKKGDAFDDLLSDWDSW